jgi:c-di-GMP-binding flagellar brake protein YcgR
LLEGDEVVLKDDPRKLYLKEKLACRAEVRNRVFTFDVRVEDIDAKGIITTPPDLGGPKLEKGSEILVRYYRSDSAYQFLTSVLSWEERTGRILMRIGFPSQITRYQRRRHVRAELTGSVRFYLTSDDLPSRGFLKDLSVGGVQFQTQQVGLFAKSLNPVGRRLLVDVVLSGGDEFIGLPGEIRRVLPDLRNKGFVSVQVKFQQLQPKVKQALEEVTGGKA